MTDFENKVGAESSGLKKAVTNQVVTTDNSSVIHRQFVTAIHGKPLLDSTFVLWQRIKRDK
ncbi:hypothetical protein EAH69_09770 [Faecalibacter macacae]|uniref:Uncharacterized protein n=1 Tax=Faecalibacter macacae TaxID=1859289 RepID=A0A3L9M6Z9_9FLAO|nr:hypothetical protein EAH69_09770 [Faecalibacter macacae]